MSAMRTVFRGAAALAIALLMPAAAQARALMPVWDAAGITKACDAGVAKARRMIAAMEAKRAPAGIFDEWNRLAIELEDFGAPIYLLSNVHPDKAARDAAEPCLTKFTTLNTGIVQS